MPSPADFLIVGAGGFAGAVARFTLQHYSFWEREKFWYTVDVNLLGCLLIGILWGVLSHIGAPRWVYNLAIAGFLGGFTTFSSFSLDTMLLFQDGRYIHAAAYLLVSLLGGLGLCAGGMWIAGKLLS